MRRIAGGEEDHRRRSGRRLRPPTRAEQWAVTMQAPAGHPRRPRAEDGRGADGGGCCPCRHPAAAHSLDAGSCHAGWKWTHPRTLRMVDGSRHPLNLTGVGPADESPPRRRRKGDLRWRGVAADPDRGARPISTPHFLREAMGVRPATSPRRCQSNRPPVGRPSQPSKRRTAMVSFWPPNPNELERATSTREARATRGT